MNTSTWLNDKTDNYLGDFAKLYEACAKKLYVTALYTLKNTADAEDLVQDTAVLAMQNFHKLRNVCSFDAWIMKILINKSKRVKYLRFKNDAEELLLDIPVEDPNSDLIITLNSAILKLPRKYRLIISLRYINDLSIKEISEILKLPEGTIKSQLHRGIEKLKHRIEVEGGL